MKIRTSNKITAFVLALMMIVPLISVPSFAAEEVVPLYSEDFEAVSDVTDVVKPQSARNDSGTIKDIGGDHGKVFYYDLSGGPAKELMADGKEKLYITTGEWETWYALDDYTINDDGTVSGVNVELGLCVDHATPGTGLLDEKIVVYNCTNVKQLHARDQYGDEIIDENDYPVWTYKYTKGEAHPISYYFVTSQVKYAKITGANIATYNRVQHPALEAKQVTYSMDLYMDANLQSAGEAHAVDGKAPLWSWSKSGTNFRIGLHGDISSTASDAQGSRVDVAANQWFNLSVYVDYETAFVALYVNGNFVQSATINSKNVSAIKAQAGNIPAAQWNIFQVNRNTPANAVSGYIMADNLKIYEGKNGFPAITDIPTTLTGETFNMTPSNVSNAGVGAMTLQGGIGGKAAADRALVIDTSVSDKDATAKDVGTSLHVKNGVGYNATGVSSNTIVLQCDYYFPSGTNAIVNVTAPSWTGKCLTEHASGSVHRDAHLTLYRITAENGKLVIPQKDHAGVPNGATLTLGVTRDLPFDEWFTITLVIDAVTGEARLYWTSEANVTTLMYTYNMMDRSVDHSEIIINSFAFSKLGNVGTGTYAVDNAMIYTDETQRPNYEPPVEPIPSVDAALPTSTVAGTNFANGSLDGVTNGGAGNVVDGNVFSITDPEKTYNELYGKAAGDSFFIVNATTETSKIATQLKFTDKTGYDADVETLVLQCDYYVPADAANFEVWATAPNWDGECGESVTGSHTHRKANMCLYSLKMENGLLFFRKQNGNGVPASATLTTGVENKLPMDTWFTVTLVITTETGGAKLYVTNGDTTTLYFTFTLFDANAYHSKIDITSFAFSKINANAAEGTTVIYAVDNPCVYTDETERPNYVEPIPSVDAALPNSTVSGTNFADGSLNGVTNGDKTGMSVVNGGDAFATDETKTYGEVYGNKEVGDSFFVVDATTATTSDGAATMIGTAANAVAGFNTGATTIVLQSDYYFPTGTVARVYATVPNFSAECNQETHTTSDGLHRKVNMVLYQIRANGTKVTLQQQWNNGIPGDATVYKSELPINEWFTLSTVINTETGAVKQYVDGELYNEWYLTDGGNSTSNAHRLSEFNINTFAFSKLGGLIANDATYGAYAGTYAIDNVCIYTDETERPGYEPAGTEPAGTEPAGTTSASVEARNRIFVNVDKSYANVPETTGSYSDEISATEVECFQCFHG